MVGWVFVGAGDHGGSRNLKGGTRTTYNHGPMHVCAESLIQTTVVLANQEFINLSKMMWGAANHDCLFFAASLLFFICLLLPIKILTHFVTKIHILILLPEKLIF